MGARARENMERSGIFSQETTCYACGGDFKNQTRVLRIFINSSTVEIDGFFRFTIFFKS